MKKYTIMKSLIFPDEFEPGKLSCSDDWASSCLDVCPFSVSPLNSLEDSCIFPYGLGTFGCPFKNENGWSCRVNDVTEDDEFVHFTDKEAVEYKDSLMKAYKSTGINIFDMRDATPEEEKGVTDYIMSIAEPTGIKFDEVE